VAVNEIVCPNCGEDENLKGDSKESGNTEKVTVICETCEMKWERNLTPKCPSCASEDLRTAVRSIVDKSRGTQLSIQSLTVVYLCPECDVEELIAWNQSNTPLPPYELPYDIE